MSNAKLAAAVQRGAKLLDQTEPGWAGKIDLARLEMSSTCRCVLGQLHGTYDMGTSFHLDHSAPSTNWTAWSLRHGFTLVGPHDPDANWNKLKRLWEAAITARLPSPETEQEHD